MRFLCAALLPWFVLVAQPKAAPTYDGLNALAWVQRSAEYHAITWQTFQAARSSLKIAMEQLDWTAAVEQEPPFKQLPPAIILDLDETVLDNSSYRVKMLNQGLPFTEDMWQQWVDQEQALAIPGAVEFLQFAHSSGVMPFYITGRICDASSPTDHTVAVLKRLHFPYSPARLLCRTNASESSNKSARRAKVAATHRVLLLLGDDLNDFVSVPNDERQRVIQAHYDKWGVKWFLLPNPMYGSWERAIGESTKAKLDALRP